MKNIILLLLFFICLPSVHAQIDSLRSADSDLLRTQFPSIEILLDAAVRNAPTRKYYETRRLEDKSMLLTISREWTKYISFGIYYKYGMMGAYSTSSTTIGPIDTQNSQLQNWFQVGVSIDIPLLEFIDRRNKRNRQRLKMEQSEYEASRMSEEVKEKVINEYNNALMSLTILRTKSENLDLNNVQYIMSENNFVKGRIDIADLSRLKQLQVSSLIDYEATKAQFRTSLMLLEMLTGYKFINKHE